MAREKAGRAANEASYKDALLGGLSGRRPWPVMIQLDEEIQEGDLEKRKPKRDE